ncbi:ATP-binding protein [Yinghuangia seranimata]|uniref:ATP-binding protein n=1 Tax=Yinghuangia seranimata TaxID=408067 RepID=UPI00248AAE0F|nr:ATP-binding protein [Yinghuangia seranimata]MDI2129471.1 ATP-binding protein [Yinghuangia seranimata]
MTGPTATASEASADSTSAAPRGAAARLRRLGGLRLRLVAAFVLVAAFASLVTAALTYREARAGLLQRSQDRIVGDLRTGVDAIAPSIPFPPDQAALDSVARDIDKQGRARGSIVIVVYRDLRAESGMRTGGIDIPPPLRAAVTQRTATVFQRFRHGGEVWLAVGVPITFVNQGPSGVQVYLLAPMRAEAQDEASLVKAARRGAVPAVLFALIPAFLAAAGVLRPVRALQDATRRLARGRLDTRLKAKGASELADLARDFNHTAAALEQNVAQLRTMEARARGFAADVSHELRTPLAAMAAVTDLLDEDAAAGHVDADTASALRLISTETGKLTRLVDDLMEICRFDAGAATLHLDEFDIAEAVRRCLDHRGWQNAMTLELPVGIRVEADPRRFDVVVANLVQNALRHGAPPIGIRLTLENGADGTWILLRVHDRGPGIAADRLDRVFERFYKADAARTRSEGSGLGMAITRENVLLHGGRIHAANRPDGGAEFTVELPQRAHHARQDPE